MALKVHHLRPAPGARTAKTRVGRGTGSKGKTAGRGTKGTKARYQVPATFEGGQTPIHMRLPRIKGFKSTFKTTYQVVNAGLIAERFPAGGEVGPDQLVEAGLVRANTPVKVLGGGDVTVALTVHAHAFSETAKQKIASAGGTAAELAAADDAARNERGAPRRGRRDET